LAGNQDNSGVQGGGLCNPVPQRFADKARQALHNEQQMKQNINAITSHHMQVTPVTYTIGRDYWLHWLRLTSVA